MILSLVGIIAALLTLMICVFKRVNTILASLLAAVVVCLMSRLNILETLFGSYVTGLGGYVGSNFLLLQYIYG